MGKGPRLPLRILSIIKWFILACASVIALVNLLYWLPLFKTAPRAIRQLNEEVATISGTGGVLRRMHGGGGAQGAGGGAAPKDWAEVVRDVVAHEPMRPRALAGHAALLCVDMDPACGTMLNKGICRPLSLSVDGTFTCKRSCQLCNVLARTVSTQLEMPVAVSHWWACGDEGDGCAERARQGECTSKPQRMLAACKRTCKFCAPPSDTLTTYLADDATGSGSGSSSQRQGGAAEAGAASPPPTLAPLPPLGERRQTYCFDSLEICPYLASQLDLCASRLHWWMPHLCPESCQLCPGIDAQVVPLDRIRPLAECADYNAMCAYWKTQGMCTIDQMYMSSYCSRSCNLCAERQRQLGWQTQQHTSLAPVAPTVLGLDAGGSLRQVTYVLGTMPASACTDQVLDQCAGWARSGECTRNVQYMQASCQKSCNFCGPAKRYLQQPLQQVLLSNGVLMPTVGFGTAALGDGTQVAVEEALRAGYRHFDSAQAYEWYRESAVGAAILSSGIKRSELFLTTKIHPKHLGYNATLNAFATSLSELHTPYLDLVLLHYPRCWAGLAGCSADLTAADATWQGSWRALEELYRTGKVRAIGVSNFAVDELRDLLGVARVHPHVVQVHVDPLAPAADMVELCLQTGIQLEAYSSLGTQWLQERTGPGQAPSNPVLTHPTIVGTATKLGRSPAQVVLRWVLQLGVVVLPRSSNAERMRQNLDLFSFELSSEQMAHMMGLGRAVVVV